MHWLFQILGRRRLYDDLAEEIRQHLEEKTAALMAGGLISSLYCRRRIACSRFHECIFASGVADLTCRSGTRASKRIADALML